jgi:iron complex outermembrane receptor protein
MALQTHRVMAAAATVAIIGIDGISISNAQETTQLEEVVVTARKREENLQTTPVAVSALSSEAIAARAITDISEVSQFVPNVHFDSAANIAGSSANLTAFIRGIGQTDFVPTVDPGVGIYLDGVYIGRTVGALLDTADIDRVEVLRGPQGTLFGKNTIGGAVVVTSRRPGTEWGADVELTTGEFNRADVKFGVDLPFSDAARMRITGNYQSRDGYQDRLLDDGQMGNRDSLSGRLLLDVQPSDTFDLTLAVDATRNREEAAPLTVIDVAEEGVFAFFHNQFLFGDQCLPPASLDNPNCYTARWIAPNKDSNSSNAPNESDLDLWGASLSASWDLGAFKLKSISAYREFDSTFFWDGDGSPLVISQSDDKYDQSQFSQEFQLSGLSFDERLKWLVGLYYLNEEANDVNYLSLSFTEFVSGGRTDNDSYAAFAQVTYSLTPEFNITLGGRYSDEEKRFTPDQYIVSVNPLAATNFGFAGDPGNPNCYYFLCNPLTSGVDPPGTPLQAGDRILPFTEVTASASEFTPAITLDYAPTDHVLTYATYSQGFKGGGFTQRIFPPEPAASSFDPETAEVYELGAKSEWFDRRWRLNGALFSTNYDGLQVIVTEGIAPKVRNAGSARIQGAELESEAVLTERLRLSASLGYLDAEYRSLSDNVVGIALENELPNAPEITASAGVSVDAYSGSHGLLTLRADWSYQDAVFKDAANKTAIRQPAYSLVNANVAFTTQSGKFSVVAGVTNLTDERVIQSGYSNLDFDSFSEVTYGRPREWFLTLRAKL